MSALSDLVKYAQVGDVRYIRGEHDEPYSRSNEAATELAYLRQVERQARILLEIHEKRGSYWHLGDDSDEEVPAWELIYQSSLERDRVLTALDALFKHPVAEK